MVALGRGVDCAGLGAFRGLGTTTVPLDPCAASFYGGSVSNGDGTPGNLGPDSGAGCYRPTYDRGSCDRYTHAYANRDAIAESTRGRRSFSAFDCLPIQRTRGETVVCPCHG